MYMLNTICYIPESWAKTPYDMKYIMNIRFKALGILHKSFMSYFECKSFITHAD